MHVSKIVQRPHGHFVLIIMEDYQRQSQRCNYNLCWISKDPAAHEKDNVQRLQKYQNTQFEIQLLRSKALHIPAT